MNSIISLITIGLAAVLVIVGYIFVGKKNLKSTEFTVAKNTDNEYALFSKENFKYTFLLITLLIAGVFLYVLLKGYQLIAYIITAFFAGIIRFNKEVNFYLDKRN